MKFSVGDLVVEKKLLQAHTSYPVNKVIAILNGEYLTTSYGHAFDGKVDPYEDDLCGEPGSRSWRASIARYQEQELISMDEALRELRVLEADQSKLESEFQAVRYLIKEKMEKAATLVREAAAIAKPFDKDLYDLKPEGKDLYSALNDGGWSHSHMRC